MGIISFRIGVPCVAVASVDDAGVTREVHRLGPTTGGVKFSYSYTKSDVVEIEVGFKMLGDGKPLVPGHFYHLVVTMPPMYVKGEEVCEVRQCRLAKCGKIVTTYPDDPNSGPPVTEFTFTFPETLAESNLPWRDVLIYGSTNTGKSRRRRKAEALVESSTSGQDRPSDGEAPATLA